MLTILFGQGLGIVFGLNEDAIKGRLKTSAAAVRDTVYKGDDAAIKAVLDKSWVYMQRAHLHAGGMGTTALALIVLVGLLGASRRLCRGHGPRALPARRHSRPAAARRMTNPFD